jgi:hypothetical protein
VDRLGSRAESSEHGERGLPVCSGRSSMADRRSIYRLDYRDGGMGSGVAAGDPDIGDRGALRLTVSLLILYRSVSDVVSLCCVVWLWFGRVVSFSGRHKGVSAFKLFFLPRSMCS